MGTNRNILRPGQKEHYVKAQFKEVVTTIIF